MKNTVFNSDILQILKNEYENELEGAKSKKKPESRQQG